MHSIPPDIISRIGLYMSPNEQSACLQAAKCFDSVCHFFKGHCIRINKNNVKKRLMHLSDIAVYVQSIKPRLEVFGVYFDSISLDEDVCISENLHSLRSLFEHIPYDKVVMYMFSCDKEIMDVVLAHVPKNVRVHIKSTVGFNPPPHITLEYYNDILRSGHNTNVLAQPNVAACTCIDVVVSPTDPPDVVDFESVDVSKNNCLIVTVYKYANYACAFKSAWKITEYNEFIYDAASTSPLVDIIDTEYAPRMQNITYFVDDQSRVMEYMQTTKDIINALPRDVEYRVIPHSPIVISFINVLRSRGINRLKYVCHTHDMYLCACLCKRLPNLDFDIIDYRSRVILHAAIMHTCSSKDILAAIYDSKLKSNWCVIAELVDMSYQSA